MASTFMSGMLRFFQGATAKVDGKIGLVTCPKAGDQAKFLRGDGAWAFPDGVAAGELPFDPTILFENSLL